MELSLFSREYVHTDLQYEDNLKIRELFEHFYSKETSKLLLDFCSVYCDEKEIVRRQKFFHEITGNLKCREFLKSIRSFYRDVENAVLIYKKKTDLPDKDIWGINLLNQYTKFVKSVVEIKSGSGLELCSEILKSFYCNIADFYMSESFNDLCKSLDDVELKFSEIRKMNIYGNYISTLISSYGLKPGIKENIYETIALYLSDMGLELPKKTNVSNARDMDLYEKYISYIVSKTPAVSEVLRKVNDKFSELIQSIGLTEITDIKTSLACCELYDLLTEKNIKLCYPLLSEDGIFSVKEASDITLLMQKDDIVTNSLELSSSEQVSFVSGANGGGKTSFVRAIGICNVMFSCGLFVPAMSGKLSVCDNIFTVFPHKELLYQEGRFVTEKGFMEKALSEVTSNSLVLTNELFSSTNDSTSREQYELFVSRLQEKGVRSFLVTHFTDVIELFASKKYPCFSCVMEDDVVTFRVERTGKHSSSVNLILEKYSLRKHQLKGRLELHD